MRVISKVANQLKLFLVCCLGLIILSVNARAEVSLDHTGSTALVLINNQEDSQAFRKQLQDWLAGKINWSQWRDIRPNEAALKALENNLNLQQVHIDAEIKHAAIAEARAVFDPQLAIVLSYTKTQRNDRVANLDRYKKATITIAEGDPLPQMDEEGNPVICQDPAGCLQANGSLIGFAQRIPLDGGAILCTERLADENGECHMSAIPDNDFTKYVMLDSHRDAGFYPSDPVKASESFLTGDALNNVVDMSVRQNLPWGGNLNLIFSINKKDAFWVNNNNDFSDLRDIYHNQQTLATYASYDRPWASSLSLSASLPLPKTKDFGANNQFDNSIKRAVVQDRQSSSEVKRVINQTLLDVAQTYWELVAAKHELILLMSNLEQLQALQDNTARMYQQRMLTRYDKEQIDQEFKQVKLQFQQVLQKFLSQAYQLRKLMGERSALAMPVGYDYAGQKPLVDDYPQLLMIANDFNPELEVQQYNQELADLNLKFNQNQARPDVSLNLALRAGQNNAIFGYESLSDSVSEIASPDTILQQVQLSYRYPIANRQAKANVKQAARSLRTQELSLQQQKNAIAYALENELIAIQSARLSSKIAKRHRDLALKTLNKAIKQQELREVTEYEIVDKNQVLLQAERQLISTQKSYKQAEAGLLFQLGLLPAHYAEHTLDNAFDNYRLNYLKAYRQLYFFTEPELGQ